MEMALCHSMQYAEKAKEVQQWFHDHGHEVHPSSFNEAFIGLSEEEKEALKCRLLQTPSIKNRSPIWRAVFLSILYFYNSPLSSATNFFALRLSFFGTSTLTVTY